MTDEQLERAARRLCELRGFNPNAATTSYTFTDSMLSYQTYGDEAKAEILLHIQRTQAIEEAMK